MRRFLRKRVLLTGFLAVLVPLVILLTLQFRWLTRLEETSAIAEKASLNNYLNAVFNEIEYFYRSQAEHALNAPSYLLKRKPEKIELYFRKKAVDGARYLFVVPYVDRENWGGISVYNVAQRKLGKPDPDAAQAINVALSPWKMLAWRGSAVPSHDFSVDQMDDDNVLLLKPLTDNACQLQGMAGMVLDTTYFEEVVLPAAIEKSLPQSFNERERANLVVTVRDQWERLVFGGESDEEAPMQVSARVPFIFSDWTVALGSRFSTPEQLAQSNFLLNMSMSVLLAVVLLGGIVLALRTASREIHLSNMKADFVSNVSHELRTPLASIRVFGEFLRLGRVEDEGKVREYGEYIETESRRLTQLINNILDFSKIESGAKTYEFREDNLHSVVADTLHTMEVGLKHMGFELEFVEPVEPLPSVRMDRDAITQALANLVENAVKYSNGSKKIRVRLEQDDGCAVIAVRDWGCGISSGEQKKIFERFHRVGTGQVHDVKGSGLGLSIVSHIVKAHGGIVEVTSEPGAGSTFRLHLPCGVRTTGEQRDAPPAVGTVQPMGKT
ncbi:MAG: HAMP domain-containing histidine kinase [bacterium]|nr:HAMP domain-containing histidine kinase [bacterium]